MNKYLLICTLVFSSFATQASNLINDESIKDQKNCFNHIFKDYATWRGFIKEKRQKRIKSEEKLLKGMAAFDSMFGEEKFNQYKNNLSCITFKYNVDDLEVSGYVIKPKSNKKKLPVLIYNRGGNGSYGSVVFGSMMHNLFPIANEGFVIIGSQYRLSRTKGVLLDEFGGKDVNDVIALLDYIPKIKGADEKRIGMYGFSRGGMQTHLVLKETSKIKAIATIAGATDLLKELDFRPAMEKVYTKRITDYGKNKVAELEKRSVLNWVSELSPNIPILLLHGEDDKKVSVNNSIELASALAKNSIPHKLVIYPKDDHGLIKNKEKANEELVSWFREYL
ncbi:alpha/beta hydrolase family protein [Thalassotalea profundi]|uniref:Peptidase n=1 Tax=Thalassotalea profundi TaxID=2036687 RepID=A0ABQ3IVZ5_9GAMM|nr:prolyl oligopeptidase family serine peptidase [Thalassotalea profundi]GHE95537.1 peptidase [Thalassotalea profundi]